jgi:hypothetical protein
MLLISKKVDPNKSHPHRRKEIMAMIGNAIHGVPFTTRAFDAMVWHHNIKQNERFCWKNESTNTFQYSPELVPHLKSFTSNQVEAACQAYTEHQRENQRRTRRHS